MKIPNSSFLIPNSNYRMLPSSTMAEARTLSLALRTFLKTYPWRRIDPVPMASLQKPVNECKVALVTSAGFVVPGEEPFSDAVRGGDYSFREIAGDVDVHPKDRGPPWGLAHAHVVEDEGAALHAVREHVHRGVLPGHELAVQPDPALDRGFLRHGPSIALYRLVSPRCGRDCITTLARENTSSGKKPRHLGPLRAHLLPTDPSPASR